MSSLEGIVMWGTMKEFDLQHWWNLVAAGGAIIAIIFFVAQLNHGFLFGLGLLLFGIERADQSSGAKQAPARRQRGFVFHFHH